MYKLQSTQNTYNVLTLNVEFIQQVKHVVSNFHEVQDHVLNTILLSKTEDLTSKH